MKHSRGLQMVALVKKSPDEQHNRQNSNQRTVGRQNVELGMLRDLYENTGQTEYIELRDNNTPSINYVRGCVENVPQAMCAELVMKLQDADFPEQANYAELHNVTPSNVDGCVENVPQAICAELSMNLQDADVPEQSNYVELQNVTLDTNVDGCVENVPQAICAELAMNLQDADVPEQANYAELQKNIILNTNIEGQNVNQATALLNSYESGQQEPASQRHFSCSETISDSDEDSIVLYRKRKNHNHHVFIAESSDSEIIESDNNNNTVSTTATASEQTTDSLSRKRKRDPKKWKRNSQKILRMEGKEYQSRSGKKYRAKIVKEVNCKCHYKCTTKIDKSQQKKILADYLSLDSERARWAFIGNSVNRVPVKRRYHGVSNKRQHTLQYTIMCNDQRVQVCKQFFLATYDISGKKVETALKKLTPSGVTEIDHRGHKEPPNKKSEEVKNIIRDHIKSLPVVASHYCRSSSKRKYLQSGLSETRIYLDYVEYCKEKNILPEKLSLYKSIFVSEFNYGFHVPKKDQCDYCTQFKNKSAEEKGRDEEEYKLHLMRKEESRDHKKVDKARAKCDPTFSCFTMDLEKVLVTPSLQVGQLYYTKKLKTYNFTLYDLATGQATNYMWHEGVGTKGASEIATCLWNLLVSLGPKKEVTVYSDTASGQNRNSVVSTMLLRAVAQLPIDCINQKFMESGHSEMECDSVHSTIEARGRQVDVFTPEGWYMVARTAKTTKPYHKVVEMEHSDFLNYKQYSEKMMTNKTQSEDGSRMKWLKVKWFQYRKGEPTTIYYKYRLSDNDFESLKIQRRQLRKSSTLPLDVPRLHISKPKIDPGKLKDLLKLCQKGSIPSTYHDFYKSLRPEDGFAQDNSSCSESDGDD